MRRYTHEISLASAIYEAQHGHDQRNKRGASDAVAQSFAGGATVNECDTMILMWVGVALGALWTSVIIYTTKRWL